MAANTKPVNMLVDAQERGMHVLETYFPPGTHAWAFWSDLVHTALDLFEAGDLLVLSITASRQAKPDRNGPGRKRSKPRVATPEKQDIAPQAAVVETVVIAPGMAIPSGGTFTTQPIRE